VTHPSFVLVVICEYPSPALNFGIRIISHALKEGVHRIILVSFFALLLLTLVADPSREDVAVTQLIQKLSLELLFGGFLACWAHDHDIVLFP